MRAAALALAALAAAGPAGAGSGSAAGPAAVPPEYLAPQWRVVALDGAPVAAAAELVIAPDGTITGQAPCNTFRTLNRAAFPALDLAPVVATRRACPALAEEAAFLAALSAMTAATVAGLELTLTGPGGRSMRLIRPLY